MPLTIVVQGSNVASFRFVGPTSTLKPSFNNAYWFFAKICAHDWHLRHTWPVTRLLLTQTNLCPFIMTDKDLARLCFRAQIPKQHLGLSHLCVSVGFFCLYRPISAHFIKFELESAATVCKWFLSGCVVISETADPSQIYSEMWQKKKQKPFKRALISANWNQAGNSWRTTFLYYFLAPRRFSQRGLERHF